MYTLRNVDQDACVRVQQEARSNSRRVAGVWRLGFGVEVGVRNCAGKDGQVGHDYG
jgi:hypothetical protein